MNLSVKLLYIWKNFYVWRSLLFKPEEWPIIKSSADATKIQRGKMIPSGTDYHSKTQLPQKKVFQF